MEYLVSLAHHLFTLCIRCPTPNLLVGPAGPVEALRRAHMVAGLPHGLDIRILGWSPKRPNFLFWNLDLPELDAKYGGFSCGYRQNPVKRG